MNNKESWRSMPGGFTGYLAGKRVMFETFNAIHIDIWSDNGSPLKFKSGHSNERYYESWLLKHWGLNLLLGIKRREMDFIESNISS
jgi:hypothetical protein